MIYVYLFLILLDNFCPLFAVFLQDVALLLRVGLFQRSHLALPHALLLVQSGLQLQSVLFLQVEYLVAVLFLEMLDVQLPFLYRPL